MTREKFLLKVDKTETCWLWTSYRNAKGYGCTSHKNKSMLAHRMSFKLFKENFDADLCVLHHCDNPSCVNPNHLFVGTQKENMEDCIRKNRLASTKGSHNGFSKITEGQVIIARDMYKTERLNQGEIAQLMGISPITVNHIMTRRLWKHVP